MEERLRIGYIKDWFIDGNEIEPQRIAEEDRKLFIRIEWSSRSWPQEQYLQGSKRTDRWKSGHQGGGLAK